MTNLNKILKSSIGKKMIASLSTLNIMDKSILSEFNWIN